MYNIYNHSFFIRSEMKDHDSMGFVSGVLYMPKATGKQENLFLDQAIAQILPHTDVPITAFFFLLLLYVIASVLVALVSNSQNTVAFFSREIPLSAFAGVFSSFANISMILCVVFCGTKGFFTALGLLLVQTSMIFVNVFVGGHAGSLPGVFANLLALIAIIIIYVNHKKVFRIHNQMVELAVTDTLTGLPNVYACTQYLKDLTNSGETFTNVTINLNGFKKLNSQVGIEIGNRVLVEIGKRWKNIAESGKTGTKDFVSHLSGDEYALIIRGYKSEKDVLHTIRQYESVLDDILQIDGHDFYVSASFGYAECPTDAKTFDKLATYASAAMHEIKRANSSQHILRFTPDLLKQERHMEIEKDIREALERDSVYFYLQPQFDMFHQLRGFEALARLKNAAGNNLSPGEFIPVAEDAGLVDRIDSTVFRKAAKFFGSIIKDYGSDIMLSVNISVRHLMRNDFLDEVRSVLQDSGVPAKQIEIEITESIMIDSVDKALLCIGELQRMGIKLAIDDFGTGYSSLSYLHKFPAHLLKVDKSFIDQMNINKSSRDYVAAIISMGHIMGFRVISEGVEETEQLDTLREIGCDFVQGYIWGKPLSPAEAEQLVCQIKQLP